jgi:hypothetical protein
MITCKSFVAVSLLTMLVEGTVFGAANGLAMQKQRLSTFVTNCESLRALRVFCQKNKNSLSRQEVIQVKDDLDKAITVLRGKIKAREKRFKSVPRSWQLKLDFLDEEEKFLTEFLQGLPIVSNPQEHVEEEGSEAAEQQDEAGGDTEEYSSQETTPSSSTSSSSAGLFSAQAAAVASAVNVHEMKHGLTEDREHKNAPAIKKPRRSADRASGHEEKKGSDHGDDTPEGGSSSVASTDSAQ